MFRSTHGQKERGHTIPRGKGKGRDTRSEDGGPERHESAQGGGG